MRLMYMGVAPTYLQLAMAEMPANVIPSVFGPGATEPRPLSTGPTNWSDVHIGDPNELIPFANNPSVHVNLPAPVPGLPLTVVVPTLDEPSPQAPVLLRTVDPGVLATELQV